MITCFILVKIRIMKRINFINLMSTSPQNKKQNNKETSPSHRNQKKLIVQIQYCNNCQIHLPEDRHSSLKFQSQYERLKKRLNDYDVILKKKQVPPYLIKRSPYAQFNTYYNINSKCQQSFPRIGAFQIYFLNKKIYSKLQTKKWPNIDNLILQIYKIALESHAFQTVPFVAPPKKRKHNPIDKVVNNIIQIQSNSNSIDLQKLVQSKKRYARIKKNFEKIQKSNEYNTLLLQQRPNTTYVHRRFFQTRPEVANRREYYSRGHQKTNEELFNENLFDVSVKIGTHKQKKAAKQSTGRQNLLLSIDNVDFRRRKSRISRRQNHSDFRVYRQTLVPTRSIENRIDLQTQKQRLRRKLQQNLKRQAKLKQQANQVIKKQLKGINPDNLQELLASDLFD